jgi:hypothetical protein
MFRRFGVSGWRFCSIEQQFTLPLLVVAILANNPICIVQVRNPHYFHFLIDVLATPLFHGYAYFCLLVILDSVIHRRPKVWAKMIVAGFAFATEFISEVYALIVGFSLTPPIGGDSFGNIISFLEICSKLIFFGWTVWMIVMLIWQIDVTDRWKYYLYLEAFFFLTGYIGFVWLRKRVFSSFNGKETDWILGFCAHNLFVLITAYLHWPYDLFHDKNYQAEGTGGEQPEQIVEIADPPADADPESSDGDARPT